MALAQAQRSRDSRGVPEFIFNPRMGESYQEALDIKGNPSIDLDWYEAKSKTGELSRYTVAHWCVTEARFRNHLKKVKKEALPKLISLENMLPRITQQDVVYRHYLHEGHRAFVPDFGVYIQTPGENGEPTYLTLSRQMVLFCVERRKAWRMLQSKAGVKNREYEAQKAVLADLDAGKVTLEEFFERGAEMVRDRMNGTVTAKEPALANA
jgi:pyruvate-ferredoxin/flavodoxin oxidoreductase